MQEFTQRYGTQETLYNISWSDFPDELQKACEQFVNKWFADTDIDDMRDISGFNDMSVEDVLRYAKGNLPDDAKPLGEPFKWMCW